MFCTNEATKKLFKAIEDENLENFKQALEEGANVNAFDEGGMTPLMSIANIYTASSNHPQLQEMVKLLVQHKNIDINIKSKEAVIKSKPKEHEGYPVYIFQGREVVDMRERGCVYLDNQQSVGGVFLPDTYTRAEDEIKTGKKKKNTALHIACQFGSIDMVKTLLTHPDIKTNIKNYENKSPKDCIAGYIKEAIGSEFLKVKAVAQKSKQTNCAYAFFLFGALAAGLCFVVDNPTPLVATSLLFLAIGCGFLYRANTVLNCVNSSQVIANERASDVSVQVRCHSST